MENKRKIAFFDFCETIANFQTADAFVDFVRYQTQSKRMQNLENLRNWCISLHIFSIINRLTKGKYPLYKSTKLYQLKGFPKEVLEKYAERYYNEVVRQNFINKILDILVKKRTEGFEIVLVSGGYDIYLKYFAKEFGVSNIISSHISFKNEICTGTLRGLDCLNKNKVILLNEQYKKEDIISEAYSDSISDIPFLSWVNSGYVVSKKEKQNWVNNKFKEIIW